MTSKEEHELAKDLVYLRSEKPAGYLAMCGLIAGTSSKRTAAQIAADCKEYAPHADKALHILTDYLATATSNELHTMITPACAWLQKYFLDPRSPQQKAADTARQRREAKRREWEQQRLDREATIAAARSVLHDPNGNAADKLEAAARLEGTR